MIPNKDTSGRFSGIGARARGTALTGSQIRTKANGYQTEISSLQNGSRTIDWADSVKKLEKKISAEPLEVRYAIANLGVLTSLSTEAGRIKRNARTTTTTPRPTPTPRPTYTPPPQPRPAPRPTNTPTPRPTQTQNNSGDPTVRPTNKPQDPFDMSTVWFSAILFNIPTAILLFLAFTFPGWFNVWLGLAILWLIAATSFTIIGIVVDDKSPPPPSVEKVAVAIGIALPIAGFVVSMWCLFVSGMYATAIFGWIGAVLGAFFMSCSSGGNTSKASMPSFYGSMTLIVIFAIGIFALCYALKAGWATWIFGIVALLVHCVFGPIGIEYIKSDKTYIPFFYIPTYIAMIFAVADGNETAYLFAAGFGLLAIILSVVLAKKK